jgi:putative transposase
MAKTKSQTGKAARDSWGTIWEVPDALWRRIEPLLIERYPPKVEGRPHADWRRILDGIIFRMRSGCQWDKVPREFGAKSTVHEWFQRWNKDGVMEAILAMLIAECDEAGGVGWDWQSADGAMAKARFGGIKSARIPRIERKTAPSVV